MTNQSEINSYAKALPDIYREILAAFPAIEPGRKAGYGLAFQTLAIYFANHSRPFGFEDVRAACCQLADRGFIEIKNEIFAHPTQLGEELIAAVTSSPIASTAHIPALPNRTW